MSRRMTARSPRAPLPSTVALFTILLFGATVAFGADAGGESTHWLGLPRWVFSWVNMILLFGGIGYLAGPKIVELLNIRRHRIRDSLMTARRQRADAEELRSGLEGQLLELEAEVARAVERAEREGDREAQEIVALAERERSRLKEQVRTEIRNRTARARVELAEHAARLATSLAAARLEQEVDSAARRRILDRGILSLESRADNGGSGAEAQ